MVNDLHEKFAGLTYEEMLAVADGYRCPKCGQNSVYEVDVKNEETEYKYRCFYDGCTFRENYISD